jgi:hypothetical protein
MVYTVSAILLTVFRLSVRKRSKWWLDDGFAVLGMVAIILQCIVLWMRIYRVPGMNNHMHSRRFLTFILLVLVANQTASIAFFYLNSLCLYLEDWGARLSILWSIIRIAPSELTKFRLRLVGIFFFLCMVGNGIVLIATCEKEQGWHTARKPPRCKLKEAVPIYRIVSKSAECLKFDIDSLSIIAGIAADTVLVLTPIRILQGLKSAPRLKRRLVIIFCASLFMTIACIVQAAVTITLPGDPELVASLTEVRTAPEQYSEAVLTTFI